VASGATALGSVNEMKTNSEQPKSFEASLEALEQIVRELERGDLPLEKSLELFEQGIGLSRQCQERLNQAERRIEILLRDNQGRPVASPFENAGKIREENSAEGNEDVF
jgi:exodeoxyribonuclease VII small subunit